MKLRIPGKAMGVMEGSELTINPVNYDGGSPGAYNAFECLKVARSVRAGKGCSWIVEGLTEEGVKCILGYCTTVGETFLQSGSFDDGGETYSDGESLLVVAGRCLKLLNGDS